MRPGASHVALLSSLTGGPPAAAGEAMPTRAASAAAHPRSALCINPRT
jgi:hypothetical protein